MPKNIENVPIPNPGFSRGTTFLPDEGAVCPPVRKFVLPAFADAFVFPELQASQREKKMKSRSEFVAALLAAVLILPAAVCAQADRPGAILTEAVETVVVVRDVNRETRKVIVEAPSGELVTIAVPPESQNLDQVYAGSKFRVRYLQSVAVYISPTGGQPDVIEDTAMELAEKGATPSGVIVNVKQIQARVDEIDHAARTVVLTGPEGNHVKVAVDERVKRFAEIKAGDIVVVRYTEGLAMKMIKE